MDDVCLGKTGIKSKRKRNCFPPLPLFYMDSETMGDRNVRCLSLIGCYRLRVH